MIRKAMPADIPAIVELGLEALNKGAYHNMIVSREKVETMARECVTSAKNFAWVSEENGVIGGAICAVVHDCMLYERSQATVVQWYCKIPLDGAKLMREFLRWARGRPAIKMISVSLEYDADPRIGKLLQRLGLNKTLPSFIETR